MNTLAKTGVASGCLALATALVPLGQDYLALRMKAAEAQFQADVTWFDVMELTNDVVQLRKEVDALKQRR